MTDPRKAALKRKPSSPGLTGADMEQAKAEAELAAANKAYQTADATGAWNRTGPLAAQGADAAANLRNIGEARNPGAADALQRALDLLRAQYARLGVSR